MNVATTDKLIENKDTGDMTREELRDEVDHWRSVYLGAERESFSKEWIEFTVTEERMVRALLEAGGRILSRAYLQNRAYPANVFVDERTVDSHIRRLRKKLKKLGYDYTIKTSNGRGYYLETGTEEDK